MSVANPVIELRIRVGSQEEMDALMEAINTEEEEGRIETISVLEVERDLNVPKYK